MSRRYIPLGKPPNQGWQNDKEHLGRDKKKKHQNDITVGGGKVGVTAGKTAIPDRRKKWMITS